MSFLNELKQNIRQSGKVTYQFIVINVGLFLFLNIFFIFERLIFRSGSIELFYQQYLTLPASLQLLPLRFWTIITYMFLQHRTSVLSRTGVSVRLDLDGRRTSTNISLKTTYSYYST